MKASQEPTTREERDGWLVERPTGRDVNRLIADLARAEERARELEPKLAQAKVLIRQLLDNIHDDEWIASARAALKGAS